MSKILLGLLSVFLITACSKSDNSPKYNPDIQESYLSATVGQEAEILLDLGSVPYNKYKDGIVTIKQSQVALLEPSALSNDKLLLDESSSPELSILSQSGCTSIKRSTGSCNIKIRANANGLPEGSVIQGSILVHTDPLTEAETRINITAVVGAAPVVENPEALVSSTSSSIDFGELSVTDNPKDFLVTYRATSLLQASDGHEVSVPSPFSLQSSSADRCSLKNISRNTSCSVKIRLDPSLVSTNGVVSNNITFAGLSIPVSATISGNPDVGQPESSQLVWIYNGSEISSLDLGTLLSSNVPLKFNLYLKNKSSSNETVNVTISGSGYNIINRCQNKELLPNAQCSLEVRPESSAGSKSVSIAVEDQPSLSLPLSLVVTTTVEPVVTYATVDTTASCASLNLQVCGGIQNISKTYICEQYVDGIKNESYSGSDCQPLADMSPLICQSPAGNRNITDSNGDTLIQSCALGSTNWVTDDITCNNPLQHKSGLSCVNDVLTVTAYNYPVNDMTAGQGSRVVSATSVQTCVNVTKGNISINPSLCPLVGAPTETQLSPASVIPRQRIVSTSAFGIPADNTIYEMVNEGETNWYQTDINCGSPYQHKVGTASLAVCEDDILVGSDFIYPANTLGPGDGEVTVLATSAGVCTNTTKGTSVPVSLCEVPPSTPAMTYSAPSGNLFVPIANAENGGVTLSLPAGDTFNLKTQAEKDAITSALLVCNPFFIKNSNTCQSGVKKVSLGLNHGCALLSDGRLFCWGRNTDSQIGNNSTTDSSSPILVDSGVSYKDVSAGQLVTCGVTISGTVKCWGKNSSGQVGIGNVLPANVTIPTPVLNLPESSFQKVAVGFESVCALSDSKNLYCWGKNYRYQFGPSPVLDAVTSSPVLVRSGVESLFRGLGKHHCFALTSGNLECMGENTNGELGRGYTSLSGDTRESIPEIVTYINPVKDASVSGVNSTCAIDSVNNVNCWGKNTNGQLGQGSDMSQETTPATTLMPEASGKISSGFSHTCAINSNGTSMYCWGTNTGGQTGNGNTASPIWFPQESTSVLSVVGTSGIRDVSTGDRATCVVTKGHRLYCFGINTNGKLGIGTTTTPITTPTIVNFPN